MSSFYVQTLSNNSETAITNVDVNFRSLTFTNTHTASVTMSLYVKDSSGTSFYFLKDVVLPNGVTLKLENDEFTYDKVNYTLHAISNNASGKIDITKRF